MQALSGGGELPAQERVALQDFVHAFDGGWLRLSHSSPCPSAL